MLATKSLFPLLIVLTLLACAFEARADGETKYKLIEDKFYVIQRPGQESILALWSKGHRFTPVFLGLRKTKSGELLPEGMPVIEEISEGDITSVQGHTLLKAEMADRLLGYNKADYINGIEQTIYKCRKKGRTHTIHKLSAKYRFHHIILGSSLMKDTIHDASKAREEVEKIHIPSKMASKTNEKTRTPTSVVPNSQNK